MVSNDLCTNENIYKTRFETLVQQGTFAWYVCTYMYTGSCGKRGYSPKITSDFRELLVKAVFLVGCTSYVQLPMSSVGNSGCGNSRFDRGLWKKLRNMAEKWKNSMYPIVFICIAVSNKFYL